MAGQSWSFEDRRGWRYGFGGRPVELAKLLIERLSGRTNLNVSMIFTARSRPGWERGLAQPGVVEEWARKSLTASMVVRYPAERMAYVFLFSSGSDESGTPTDVLTLIYDEDIHDWRIHQIGRPASPLVLGLKPFPPLREPWEPGAQ